jgi:tripartite-type tricarboxylate transporter receptor subunit TctC
VSILKTLLTGLALLSMPVLAAAQTFPDKPIKLIVPFPAGGPSDIIARIVTQKMSDTLKQPIVLESRAGNGGITGIDAVARSKPDGYTLGFASAGAMTIAPNMETMPFEPLKDLKPITLVAKVPEMLVVAANVPAKDLKELVALAKAQPGKLHFASTGKGGLPHMVAELFKQAAKIDLIHVPYGGAAPAINDVLGGRIEMVFLDLPVLLPQIQDGKLRPIALGTAHRSKLAPNVPTTAELGMPEVVADNWYGLVAPGSTPPDVIATLNKAANDAMKDPGVIEKLAGLGVDVAPQTPEQFRDFIESEQKKWARVVKEAGLGSK